MLPSRDFCFTSWQVCSMHACLVAPAQEKFWRSRCSTDAADDGVGVPGCTHTSLERWSARPITDWANSSVHSSGVYGLFFTVAQCATRGFKWRRCKMSTVRLSGKNQAYYMHLWINVQLWLHPSKILMTLTQISFSTDIVHWYGKRPNTSTENARFDGKQWRQWTPITRPRGPWLNSNRQYSEGSSASWSSWRPRYVDKFLCRRIRDCSRVKRELMQGAESAKRESSRLWITLLRFRKASHQLIYSY